MVLRQPSRLRVRPVLFAAALTALAACGGGKTEPTTPEGPTGPAKKASVSFGATSASRPGASTPRSEVFLTLTDERGHATSHPVGTFDGACNDIGPNPAMSALTAMQCWWAGAGVQLHAVAGRGEVIVMKLPVLEGAQPDPMAREEVTRVSVEPGARIEGPQ
ncbi:MAG: hypothetical protein KA297_26735 [Kofleriaceae bacterium]|jgi:hypothetical protein|nr:hypothetical protein [Kofleriaceae bacterium]MBP6839886.1 hypothetical protein [Kofleriaceae bacterium]